MTCFYSWKIFEFRRESSIRAGTNKIPIMHCRANSEDVIFDHVDQNHSRVWLAKELSSSKPFTDEFLTRFSAGVDIRISFKL